MKSKMKKLFFGSLLCMAICSILYIFVIETDLSVRISIIIANILFAVLIFHATFQTRRTQKLLRNERDYLHDILNHIPMPLFITTKERNIAFINVAAIELFHCNDDIIGKPCHHLNTSICQTSMCSINRMEQTGSTRACYENQGQTYMVTTAPVMSGISHNGRYVELIQNISDIIETQKELEDKTIELETMSENIIGGVLITTMEEGFPVIRCNQGYRDMTGRSDAQIVGHHAMQWVTPEDTVILNRKIKEQLAIDNNVRLEHRLHTETGSTIWVYLRGKSAKLRDTEVGVWILTDISAIKNVEMALKIDEERYRVAMQSTQDIIIDYDMKTHVMYHSSKAKEIYGIPELVENMPQSILDSGTVLAESKDEYLGLFKQLSDNVEKCSCILQARAADGRILWNRLTFTSIFDDEGNTAHAIGVLQDITRERTIELQQQRDARFLEMSSKDGNFYYEADLTNRRFLSGHEGHVQTYCKATTDNFDSVMKLLIDHKVYEEDRELVHSTTNVETLTGNFETGILHTSIEYRRMVGDKPIWSECSLRCFIDSETNNLHCIASIRNIHERKEKELLLQEKAQRDLSTGLYNKMTTQLLIQNLTNFAPADKVCSSLLLIDLDDFKQINDTLGHASGDEVLYKVSQELASLFRQNDIVGRIGGDEFVVYMNNIGNPDIASKKANQICEMFHQIRVDADPNYMISGTIGIAIFPEHGQSFEELYKKADMALYHAKKCGKNDFTIFHPDLQHESVAFEKHKLL